MRFIIILAIILLFIPTIAFAQPSLLPPCVHSGNCGLCDIIEVVGNVYQWMLYFLGAVLLVLIFAGIGWFWVLRQRGDAEKIQQGKDLLLSAMWGTLFVLIAWQLVNLILFALGTKVGKQLYEDNNITTGARSTTFKLLGNPWNYICEPGKGGALANLSYNQAVCFSRGDGTPCDYKTDDKEAKPINNGGLCIGGICRQLGKQDAGGTKYASACAYLADTYKDYFGTGGSRGRANLKPYVCGWKQKQKGKFVPCENNSKLNCKVDCLTDESLCGQAGDQLCCGEVLVPGNPYDKAKASPEAGDDE